MKHFSESALHYALLLFVIALPWSNFALSVATIAAAVASVLLLLSGARPNYGMLVMWSIYLLFVPGIFYSMDMQEGLKDLRIKAPILALSLAFSLYHKSNQSSNSSKTPLLSFFIFSCTSAALVLLARWVFLASDSTLDSRLASPFISHIRLSQGMAIAAFMAIHGFFKNGKKEFAACALLILVCLFYLGWWSGLVSLGIMLIPWMLFTGFKNKAKTTGISLVLAGILACMLVYRNYPLYQPVQEPEKPSKMYTQQGKPYHFEYNDWCVENGYRCGYYIQLQELRSQWNKRFDRKIEQADDRGSLLELTVIRYLTSLGLTKDSIGISMLSNEDYKNICKGIPNAKLAGKSPIEIRMYELRDEYRFAMNGQPLNGHSLSMRFTFFKTTQKLIAQKPLTGYGTGSADIVYEEEYRKNNRGLLPQYRHRAHNQFLSLALSGGVPAALLFIILLILLLVYNFRVALVPGLCLLAVLFGMLMEDTLETQAGVALFCFAAMLFRLFPDGGSLPSENLRR